jgi:hypothetical protein
MMKAYLFLLSLIISICFVSVGYAQELDINTWPPDTDFSQEVHFWDPNGFLYDAIPAGQGGAFYESLTIPSGGDQTNEEIFIADSTARRATNLYMNVADTDFWVWPDVPEIDILVQYFANADSIKDDVGFLLGVVGNQRGFGGYTFESLTDKFEWRVFRVDNTEQRAGNIDAVDPPPSGSEFGGVNGGTIRFERVNGLIVRAIAFGPAGAFGDPETINRANVVEFNPDDYAIMAEWDFDNDVVNGLDLYRDASGDQETVESENIGPANDKRKAARPAFDDGTDATQDIYVNWEILDEHFGPNDQPTTRVKIAAEYYDDPALAGVVFGPEVYVTAGGELAFYPGDKRTVLEGSGKWREAVWFVKDVKFNGVNVDQQAAARFTFSGPVYISRMRVGVIRSSGIYAGMDPIPDTYPFDPDPYAIYAEYNVDTDYSEGLTLGTNGGDQQYEVIDNAGPSQDQRRAIRSIPGNSYINFSIVDEPFGPSSQPNATLKVAVDYYDDPALVGERFGPEVYQSEVFGENEFRFFPDEDRVTLEGTGEWRVAVWLIPEVKFNGVNQGPQAAARFWFSAAGEVPISRIRYAVIRPVGIHAGEDALADLPVNTPVSEWNLY